MARQFPGNSNDRVVSSLTANNSVRSYSIWTWRTGDGGSSLGRIWHKGTSGASLDTSFNNNATDNAYDYNRRFNPSNGIWRFTRPSTGVWAHVFISHDMSSDANDPIIRLDNALQSLTEAQVPSGTVANNSTGYCLGNREDLARGWDGRLAEFGVWNVILNDAEAAALAAGVSPLAIRPASLVEYLPLVRDAISRKLAPPTVTGTTIADHPRIFALGAVRALHVPAQAYVLTGEAGVFTLTGNAATLKYGRSVQAAAGVFTETGQAAELRAARRLTSDTGALTVTGNDAQTLAGRRAIADAGSFALTGSAASLRANRTVTADAGALALNGQNANLLAARRVGSDTGPFIVTGNNAGVLVNGKFPADTGAFVLTGNNADLIYTPAGAFTLTAETGSFALTGNAAGSLHSRRVIAEAGNLVETGNAANLLHGRRLASDPGAFIESGLSASLTVARRLPGDTGALSVNGNAASLLYGRSVTAGAGAFSLTLTDASLRATRQLIAAGAVFTLTGRDAQFFHAGKPGERVSDLRRSLTIGSTSQSVTVRGGNTSAGIKNGR